MKIKLIISGIILLNGLLIGIHAQQVITLKQAIRISKENNPHLKTELFNEEIAKADIITAELRPNLILNNQSMVIAGPGLFESGGAGFNKYNTQTYWQVTKQMIPMRQWKKEISLAEMNVTRMKDNYAELERNVYLQISMKWVELWHNKLTANLISKATSFIDTVISTNLRKGNQSTAASDLLRMKLLAEQYRLQVKILQQQHANDLIDLKFLTGSKNAITIDVNDNFFAAGISEKMDALLYYALNNRTDLKAEYTTIEYTKKNIDFQKALAWPIPDVGVNYSGQNGIPYVGVYGTIELPFFYRNQGEIQKSKIIAQQAEQSLQIIQQQVVNEVRAALNTYSIQKQTVEEYKKILVQSEQMLSAVKLAYFKGTTTLLDFLDAQRSWLDTQKMYYDMVADYRKSYIQVLYVTGLITIQ